MLILSVVSIGIVHHHKEAVGDANSILALIVKFIEEFNQVLSREDHGTINCQ